jgi:hypothetical protein
VNLWQLIFGTRVKGSGTPADKKPHETHGGEEIDPITGIAKDSGQIVDDMEIDPTIQDREHGFDVPDPQNPEKK